MGNCLNCQHWLGNTYAFRYGYGCNFEVFRQAIGKCNCEGTTHYYNDDNLSANDGCSSWERHSLFKSAEEIAREARESAEKEKRKREAAEERRKAEAAEREAFEKLRTAAEQGDTDAQFKVGQRYFSGQGITQDYAKAAEWFSKAAAQEHVEAKDWLAKTEAAIEEEKARKAREAKEAAERAAKKKIKKLLKIIPHCIIGGVIGGIIGLIPIGIGVNFLCCLVGGGIIGNHRFGHSIIGAILGGVIGLIVSLAIFMIFGEFADKSVNVIACSIIGIIISVFK